MAQPVAVRRRATTLAAVEINGGTMSADEAPPLGAADEEAAARPGGAPGGGPGEDGPEDDGPAAPPAPAARRRGPTTMAVVEAAGDSLGIPDEALEETPEPAAEKGDGADMGDTLRGITPFPTNADGLPLVPIYAAERIAAGARGEFFVPPSPDEAGSPGGPRNDAVPSGGADRAEAADGAGGGADPEGAEEDDRERDEDRDEEADRERDEDRDDFPRYAGIDPLHEEIMALLLAPRRLLRQQCADEVATLLARRGDLSARLGAPAQADAQSRPADGRAGRPGLLGGLIGGLRRDPARRLGAAAADIDRALARQRAFGRRVLDVQYRQAADAADAMYRTYAALDREVKDFDARFAATTKGANFLKALDYVAGHRGIGVDELRARIDDLSDADETVAKLRARQRKLRADPEFAEQLGRIDGMADLMARHGERLRASLEMLESNGVDLSALGDLGERIEDGMKVKRPLLPEPGRDGSMERLQETLRKLAESLREIVGRILARLRGVAMPGVGPAP